MSISDNLKSINERIARAAERSGRNAGDVKLIAVSKTVGAAEVLEAIKCGQTEFAENRVQVLREKLNGLDEYRIGEGTENPEMLAKLDSVNWHLIGHLQTNKIKYCASSVQLIHSLDRIELAEEISRYAVKNNIDVHCLLQLNVSGEESKFGLDPANINEFIEKFASLKSIYIDGLMTMAPFEAEPVFLHKIFAKTRQLSVDISKQKVHNVSMSQLSMGMSGDFEYAIEEGATMVRIGTAVFH